MNNLHSKINMKNVLWGIEKSYGRLRISDGKDMRCSTLFFNILDNVFHNLYGNDFKLCGVKNNGKC